MGARYLALRVLKRENEWRRGNWRFEESEASKAILKAKKTLRRCAVCNKTEELTIDHRKPFCFGGKTEADNLQYLCDSCHNEKTRLEREALRKKKEARGA